LSESDLFDVQLEMKDRLNYPHLLESKLIAFGETIRKGVDTKDVQQQILDIFTDIPRELYDEQFKEDLTGVLSEREIDIRPEFGGYKLSKEHCEKFNLPIKGKVYDVDYFKLKHAIMNLLFRRNMLLRKDKVEQSTGRNLDDNIEDLLPIDFEDDEDEEDEEI